jgi:cell wall-associated NlpC family hydrolase
MRRIITVVLAAASALTLVLFTALAAGAQANTSEQYRGEDPALQESTTGSLSTEATTPVVSGSDGSVSEGSAGRERASAEELSNMVPPEPYSQVVDNASRERFLGEGWESGPGDVPAYGGDYNYREPSADAAAAHYKVKIPETGYYTVYARWPAQQTNNTATRFGISTTSGIQWVEEDQQRDGNMWIRLGAFEMEAGDTYAVQVSPRSQDQGQIIADAVMVIRGTQVAPPEDGAVVSSESLRASRGGGASSKAIVKMARRHIGTKYVRAGPGPCKSMRAEDCSCHTKVVFRKFDRRLPDNPIKQAKYGHRITRKSNLRPGDLVFFKEGRSRVITHVGIYAGGGDIVHASSYWGRVVERPMRYVDGFVFGSRLKPH